MLAWQRRLGPSAVQTHCHPSTLPRPATRALKQPGKERKASSSVALRREAWEPILPLPLARGVIGVPQ